MKFVTKLLQRMITALQLKIIIIFCNVTHEYVFITIGFIVLFSAP